MEHKTDHTVANETVYNGSDDVGARKNTGGKIKRHCRKFWWLDLILLTVFNLIIILPLVFVAIPKKAQHDVNASTIEVKSQEVTQATPDGIHLKLVTEAKSGSSFHPTIKAFRAGLSLDGKNPFLYVNVPATKANAVTEINVEEDVKFSSLDQFVEYNKVVMGNEEFKVYMNGKTHVKLSILPTMAVNYDKIITMKGLNKLQGLNITDLKVLSGKGVVLADGSNLIGNITIPNPSVMTLDLGNVTMNLAVDGTSIGYTLIPNLILKPGDNTVPMQSTVDELGIISLIKSKYTNAVIPLDIVGNSSVANGEHLTYYEAAIKSNTIRLDLDVGPALKAVGITV